MGEGPGALVRTVPLVSLREVYTASHRRAGAEISILRHPLIASEICGLVPDRRAIGLPGMTYGAC